MLEIFLKKWKKDLKENLKNVENTGRNLTLKIFLTTPKETIRKLLCEENEEICLWVLSKVKDKFKVGDIKMVGEECYLWIKDEVAVNDAKRKLKIRQLSL